MQKVGAVIGPIVGGIVAYLFGSQFIFIAALVLLFVGVIPLMLTSEPTKLGQKLHWNINLGKIKHDLLSSAALNLENTISVMVWPMFVGIMIFTENPYIQLGSVVSVSILASIFVARGIGKFVDNRKGRTLLRFSLISNAVLHLFRPFLNGFPSVLAMNIVNEGVTLGYTIPYMKGMYNAADEHPGYRIVYIAAMEFAGSFSRMIFYTIATVCAITLSSGLPLFIGIFIVAALASLAVMGERFSALKQ